jgi:lipoprotein NlpD
VILFSRHIQAVLPIRLPPATEAFCRRRTGLPVVVSAVLLLLAMLGLSGCNTNAIYGDDLYNPPVYWGSHVVKPGETLYGIAWRYGRDYRELGDANGLAPPWNIKAGQVLRLDRKGTIRQTAQASPPPRQSAPAPRPSTSTRAPAPTASKPAARAPAPAPQTRTGGQVASDIRWNWPHSGTVIANFSESGKVNKGIDIAGNPGDAVKAAANGSVVYAGNGLLGYGNLIIVNHNEHYLSAYAHNRKILVQEGEDVKAGQVIAELGSSGTDKPMLHFEIRKNGNPVDPARYLPRR